MLKSKVLKAQCLEQKFITKQIFLFYIKPQNPPIAVANARQGTKKKDTKIISQFLSD